jgi:hypothetical protein
MLQPDGTTTPDFDVALSFAGEDREYVDHVARRLRESDIRVFYDEFMVVELWGADLYSYLDDVYRNRARYAVVFVSKDYARKSWTSHERQSVQARAMSEQGPYLLPVRLDDSDIPGLRPTTGYIDARTISPDSLAALIQQKVATEVLDVPKAPRIYGVPRTETERRELVSVRPVAWEYLLFASVLREGKEALESKYRDHQLQYASGGPRLSASDVQPFVARMLDVTQSEIARVETLFSVTAQEWAFGAPGSPGNPENIVHLGQRVVGIYAHLLNWAAEVRAATASSDYSHILATLANFATVPISQSRQFIDEYTAMISAIPVKFANGERNFNLGLTYTVSVDPKVTKEFNRELKRLKRRGKW